MAFKIFGLDPVAFIHLYGKTDAELSAIGVVRIRANTTPGFPDRIEMRDVDPDEYVLLLNYVHQPAKSPYRSSHAIFIREGAMKRYDSDMVPEVMRRRTLSVRGFDADDFMTSAELTQGACAHEVFERLLAHPGTRYLHVHNAERGCYSGMVLPA